MYRLKNLTKCNNGGFEVSVVDIRLDVYRFVVKKFCVAKWQFVLLSICDAYLPAKQGNFTLKRGSVNGYFIVKWIRYIYKQLDLSF